MNFTVVLCRSLRCFKDVASRWQRDDEDDDAFSRARPIELIRRTASISPPTTRDVNSSGTRAIARLCTSLLRIYTCVTPKKPGQSCTTPVTVTRADFPCFAFPLCRPNLHFLREQDPHPFWEQDRSISIRRFSVLAFQKFGTRNFFFSPPSL